MGKIYGAPDLVWDVVYLPHHREYILLDDIRCKFIFDVLNVIAKKEAVDGFFSRPPTGA